MLCSLCHQLPIRAANTSKARSIGDVDGDGLADRGGRDALLGEIVHWSSSCSAMPLEIGEAAVPLLVEPAPHGTEALRVDAVDPRRAARLIGDQSRVL